MQSNRLIVGTAGNVPIRVDDKIAISPSGVPYETMTAEDVVVFSMDEKRVDGVLEPSSELPLHLGVYRETAARAITYSHVPASTTLGLVADEIPPFRYYSAMLGGIIQVVPYTEFGTDELARNVTDALKGRNEALMKNHGVITIEPTVKKAAGLLPILEYAYGIHLRAVATGAPVALLPPEQMADAKAAVTNCGKQPNKE